MTYGDQLKDPRWQRKRLEIMERDNFTCTACSDTKSQFHVHHGYYEKGIMLWDYDNDTLHTLCNQCHDSAHNDLIELKSLIGTLNTSQLKYATEIISQVFYPIHKDQAKENLIFFFDVINSDKE